MSQEEWATKADGTLGESHVESVTLIVLSLTFHQATDSGWT